MFWTAGFRTGVISPHERIQLSEPRGDERSLRVVVRQLQCSPVRPGIGRPTGAEQQIRLDGEEVGVPRSGRLGRYGGRTAKGRTRGGTAVNEAYEERDAVLTADESAALVAAAEFLLHQPGRLPADLKGTLVGAVDKIRRAAAGA